MMYSNIYFMGREKLQRKETGSYMSKMISFGASFPTTGVACLIYMVMGLGSAFLSK